jgi:ABC-type amino acid transport substrate-binding protein
MSLSESSIRWSRGWLAAVAVALGVMSLGADGKTELHLVSTPWPPFTNQAGQPRFALDLVEAAFGRIDVTSTTAIVPAVQFTASLLGGAFDGSAAAWKDPERERTLLFSEPYLENRLILVGRRASDVSATTLSALTGKRIAIVQGYSYGDAVDNGGPTFVRTAKEEDCLAQLLQGAVDYTLIDELVVRYITGNYPKEAQSRLAVGKTPLVIRPLYLALRRDLPGAQGIITKFNAQIRGMVADRTYHRLLHLDWIRADVDGDGVAEYVPATDHPGASQPQSAYLVGSMARPTEGASRFYLGGHIYEDWASVPESYRSTSNDGHDDARRSTASIFTFRW